MHYMNARLQAAACCLACLSLALPARAATDLLEVLTQARQSDARYLQAQAEYDAVVERRPQARAALLPSIRLDASGFTNRQEIDAGGGMPFGGLQELDFESYSYGLSLRQALFRLDRFVQLEQADQDILRALAALREIEQELLVRVSAAYTGILVATEDLGFARAEKRSLERQLRQAEQRLELGLGTITDVEEARAGFDRATAQEIVAINAIDNAREQLREITGVYARDLAVLGTTMPLQPPQPDDIDVWTERALEQNPGVIAAAQALLTAAAEIRRLRATRLPALDLVGRHSFQSTGGRFGQTDVDAQAVGVELQLPLFQGGLVVSQVREAEQRYRAAGEVLEQARRRVQRSTREAFLGVLSGISQVRALAQTVTSSETALRAVRTGFEVGTRTSVDVVIAERELSVARRDYARARYTYLLDVLRLRQAAGVLSDGDLARVNGWLQAAQETIPSLEHRSKKP